MKFFASLAVLFIAFSAQALVRSWTNELGGDWFLSTNWKPNGVPGNGDAAMITNNGTYTVYAATNAVTTTMLTIGGQSGTQIFQYGIAAQLFITNSTVQANGVLSITNGGLTGAVLIQPGGQLWLNAAINLQLYTLSLTNRGSVVWSNGSLSVGGSNSSITYVTNSGLWQMLGNASMAYGGGGRSVFYNSGTLQKTVGSGTSTISGMDVVNLPSGIVDVLSGTLILIPNQTNVLSGTYTTASPGVINFFGPCTDGGGTTSGNGTVQFSNGNLFLRTNIMPGLKLAGGSIYIPGTTTFQNAGAITNLALTGANLRGTNRLAGTLTSNPGNIDGKLTIDTNGVLSLLSPSGTQFYSLNLINQGAVMWTTGSINVGGTPPTVISNGGSWIITGNNLMAHGGGQTACFTNYGTVWRSAGTGEASLGYGGPVIFANEASGVVRVDSGVLDMPNNFTNVAGRVWLNGGNIFCTTLAMAGGTLEGTGTVFGNLVGMGGTISPSNTFGRISVQGNLDLRTNSIYSVEGISTVGGTGYDVLSLNGGTASISNCTLQVVALPTVPVGTGFTIINKTNAGAIAGTFDSLPENATITVGAQLFQIHYGGGTGNDVTLVKMSSTGANGPSIYSSIYTNGGFRLQIAGGISAIYTVQASTNFVQWTNLGLVTGDFNGNLNFIDTNASKFKYRFYRTTN